MIKIRSLVRAVFTLERGLETTRRSFFLHHVRLGGRSASIPRTGHAGLKRDVVPRELQFGRGGAGRQSDAAAAMQANILSLTVGVKAVYFSCADAREFEKAELSICTCGDQKRYQGDRPGCREQSD